MYATLFPRTGALALATLLLAGCGNLANVQSYSTPYSAPAGGETARLRVITNGMARGVPASACIDWRREGAGVIAVAQSGFANRNGQSLGMPPSRQAEQLSQGASPAARCGYRRASPSPSTSRAGAWSVAAIRTAASNP